LRESAAGDSACRGFNLDGAPILVKRLGTEMLAQGTEMVFTMGTEIAISVPIANALYIHMPVSLRLFTNMQITVTQLAWEGKKHICDRHICLGETSSLIGDACACEDLAFYD